MFGKTKEKIKYVNRTVEKRTEVPVAVNEPIIDTAWDGACSNVLKSYLATDSGKILKQLLRLHQVRLAMSAVQVSDNDKNMHACGQVVGFAQCIDFIENLSTEQLSQEQEQTFRINSQWDLGNCVRINKSQEQ